MQSWRLLSLSVFAIILCLPQVWGADEVSIQPPEVGDKARDFELPVIRENRFVELSEEYKKGPVVLIVLRGYPGYQCPLCHRQVGSLINRVRALDQLAHRVIIVYPGDHKELVRHSERFMTSRTLPDPLVMVRDQGMEVVEQWGVRWDATHETAYPATFVIDQNGRIQWSKISDSHAGRSTVEEIVRALRKL